MRLNIAVTLVFAAAIAPSQMFSQQVDVNTTVARAETAYYEARFDDAAAMLAPLNILLDSHPGRKQEKMRVKLQLALCYIGLNEFPKAKALFSEIYDLEPEFSIDRSKYPSKVLNLAEEAKSARTKTADDLFEQGVEAYKRGDLPEASTKFQGVLKLNTSYEPAKQYLILIEDTVALSNDQIALRWHNQFSAGDYQQASESYRQLASSARGDKVDSLLDQMRSEYQKTMMDMVESWSRACTAKDEARMAGIRAEAEKVLPDVLIAPDSLQQMSKCAQDPQPAVPAEVKNLQTETVVECIQSSSETAMIRLKTRVEPESPAQLRGKQVRVRAAVRIDAQGNTTVRRLQGGSVPVNKMVVKALKEWKFHPAKVDNRARCVETELFVVVRPRTEYVSAQ